MPTDRVRPQVLRVRAVPDLRDSGGGGEPERLRRRRLAGRVRGLERLRAPSVRLSAQDRLHAGLGWRRHLRRRDARHPRRTCGLLSSEPDGGELRLVRSQQRWAARHLPADGERSDVLREHGRSVHDRPGKRHHRRPESSVGRRPDHGLRRGRRLGDAGPEHGRQGVVLPPGWDRAARVLFARLARRAYFLRHRSALSRGSHNLSVRCHRARRRRRRGLHDQSSPNPGGGAAARLSRRRLRRRWARRRPLSHPADLRADDRPGRIRRSSASTIPSAASRSATRPCATSALCRTS